MGKAQKAGARRVCVRVCVCVCASLPFVTAVIIVLEITESVCCTGSLPSDNSNLQKYFVWAPLPAVGSHQCVYVDFSIISRSSPQNG